MTSARMVDIARTYFAGAAKDWFLNVYASRCRDLGIDPLGGDIDKQVLAPRGVHVQEPIFRSSCQVSSCDINHSSRRHVHVHVPQPISKIIILVLLFIADRLRYAKDTFSVHRDDSRVELQASVSSYIPQWMGGILPRFFCPHLAQRHGPSRPCRRRRDGFVRALTVRAPGFRTTERAREQHEGLLSSHCVLQTVFIQGIHSRLEHTVRHSPRPLSPGVPRGYEQIVL